MDAQTKKVSDGRVRFIRNFSFGVEDGLVSTVGLVSGVAAAGVARETILLTGLVLIAVEGFAMGVGSLLTEREVEQFQEHREVSFSKTYWGAIVMFISYLVAGMVPLFPYIFLEPSTALYPSIGASMAALFVLGAVSAYKLGLRVFKQGIQMMLIGGTAIVLGVAVGTLLN